jgi:hypothetical protein
MLAFRAVLMLDRILKWNQPVRDARGSINKALSVDRYQVEPGLRTGTVEYYRVRRLQELNLFRAGYPECRVAVDIGKDDLRRSIDAFRNLAGKKEQRVIAGYNHCPLHICG